MLEALAGGTLVAWFFVVMLMAVDVDHSTRGPHVWLALAFSVVLAVAVLVS